MASKQVKIVGVVIAAVAVLVIGFAVGRRVVDKPKAAASSRSAKTPAGFVEFRDEQAGFAISYPKDWTRLEATDTSVVLVVSEKPVAANSGGSILGRVITLDAPVSAAQLADAKKVTDQIVTKGEGVELKAQPAAINSGGLPGYFYFYTFKDATSGQQGAHSHYFLFKDKLMISFVFQAIPDSDFVRLAKTFDEVIGTFRVLPPKQ
jgi:hypothetical protein